ncbi:MAG: Rieske 2Fe-2S domain-containing protein, partial [Acidimicrobiia bacterium]
PVEEERHARPPLPGGGPGDAGRRRALVLAGAGALVVAAGALRWLLGASRRAEGALSSTAWRPGVPLVDEQGRRVSASSGAPGAVVTVWPEGHLGDDDAQAVLVHLGPGQAVTGPGRQEWTASGFVAYSRLCTHMGCPVALYQVEANVLVCPCHQATFDVLRGARPVLGPARRPLPQLPLAVDGAEGVLVAGGDFSAPVGPGYWGRRR